VLKKMPTLGSVYKANSDKILVDVGKIAINIPKINIFLSIDKSKITVQKTKQVIRKINNKIKQLIADVEVKEKALEAEKELLFKTLEDVFNYSVFTKTYVGWGAYTLAKKLNVTVCPYCNRSFTHTINEDNGKTRPEFDHFFIKTKYPFLSVSLYNLIPSCHVCNSNLKGSKDFFRTPHINPFIENSINDAFFKTNIKADINGNYSMNYLTGKGTENDFDLNLNIKVGSPLENKIKNSSETFKIEKLYQFHKDYVLEIIKKTIFYNHSRITELADQDVYKNLFSGKDEIIQILIGNYVEEKNLGKRVLAKLTKDIWKEFKLDDVWGIK